MYKVLTEKYWIFIWNSAARHCVIKVSSKLCNKGRNWHLFTREYLWIISNLCCVNTPLIISSCVYQWEWILNTMETTPPDRPLPAAAREKLWRVRLGDHSSCMLWKEIAKTDKGLPACKVRREENEISKTIPSPMLQVHVIRVSSSASSSKLFQQGQKGKSCARKLEPNHAGASRNWHHLRQIQTNPQHLPELHEAA